MKVFSFWHKGVGWTFYLDEIQKHRWRVSKLPLKSTTSQRDISGKQGFSKIGKKWLAKGMFRHNSNDFQATVNTLLDEYSTLVPAFIEMIKASIMSRDWEKANELAQNASLIQV